MCKLTTQELIDGYTFIKILAQYHFLNIEDYKWIEEEINNRKLKSEDNMEPFEVKFTLPEGITEEKKIEMQTEILKLVENLLYPEKEEKIPFDPDQHVYEIYELHERSNWLDCLERAGVVNWDGYERACELYSISYERNNTNE